MRKLQYSCSRRALLCVVGMYARYDQFLQLNEPFFSPDPRRVVFDPTIITGFFFSSVRLQVPSEFGIGVMFAARALLLLLFIVFIVLSAHTS